MACECDGFARRSSKPLDKVRLLGELLTVNGAVVQRLRHLHDTQEIEGSIPSAITGSKRFVSVPGARVLGKNEDRVRFSNEPSHEMGSWSSGKTSPWHGENPSSNLGDSTQKLGR